MFKTIFSRLMITYLFIITIIIMVVSFALSVGYSDNIFKAKSEEQLKAANKVSRLAVSYLKGLTTKEELDSAINSIGYISDSRIYVIRMDLKSLETHEPSGLDTELNETFLLSDLKQVLKGNNVYRENQYSSNMDMHVIFTGVPLKDGDVIEGAVLLFSPVKALREEITRINMTILLWATLLTVIFIFFIYLISLRISKPITQMTNAAISLSEGEKVGDIKVNADDEIGKLADAFNKMNKQLALTEKVRSEFIANVSHDLRTPLTSINGFIQGMIDGLIKPENYEKYFSIIKEEINRLTKLTGDILEIAKIQGGAIKLNVIEVNANDIIDSAQKSIEIIAGQKDITISKDCPEKLFFKGDADRLNQVVSNLLTNAVKYTERGSEIWISAGEENEFIKFTVRDNGSGISEEDIRFVFEKFFRGDKTRQNDGGAGLGLNIAKEIVELHGGKIWVESKAGEGTAFYFTIPK